jgi:hypothetical protein
MLRIEVLGRKGGWKPWMEQEKPLVCESRSAAQETLCRMVADGVPAARAIADGVTEMQACLDPGDYVTISGRYGWERLPARRNREAKS